jgi:hypothetical protein
VRTEPVDITRKFVEALNKKFEGIYTPAGPIEFSAEPVVRQPGRNRGQTFDKIVLPNLGGSPDGSGAHAFINRENGKLYRAASKDLPVDDVRYDLSKPEDFTLAVELADPYGNYLRRNYVRKAYAGAI